MSISHIIVDTNVLLRYLLRDDEKQYQLVEHYFLSDHYKLVLPIQTLCETVWVMTHTLKLSRTLVNEVIASLINQDNVLTSDKFASMGIKFMEHGGDFADGIIAYHSEHYEKAALLTFDKKAQSIAKSLGLKVIDLD